MQFLIDACLSGDFKPLLVTHGHVAVKVREIGMGQADDADIAAYARQERLCLLTEDWGFGDIRTYPPEQYHGIVVFETTDNSMSEKLAALRNLLEREDVVEALPGRLVIVTPKKIRIRPPM